MLASFLSKIINLLIIFQVNKMCILCFLTSAASVSLCHTVLQLIQQQRVLVGPSPDI